MIVRRLTLGNLERIRRYRFLKNGAMYSVLFLGVVMICDAFGLEVPAWGSPLLTVASVGFFFARSLRATARPREGADANHLSK